MTAKGANLAPLVMLLALASLPRLALQLSEPTFGHPDSPGYLGPAYDLANGQGLTNPLLRPAGYTLLLTTIFTIFGPNLVAVSAFQHLLGLLTVAFTYLLGCWCFNRWVGLGAGLLVAMSGPQLALEHTAIAESPFTLLLLALALVLIRATQAVSHRPALLAGILLGLSALMKPISQALLPVALILAATRPGTWYQRARSVALLGGAFAVVVIPWMLWNLQNHGQLTIGGTLSSNLVSRTVYFSRGKFLFEGPNVPSDPDASRMMVRGILQQAVKSRLHEVEVLERVSQRLNLSGDETDRLVQQVILETVKRQPVDFVSDIPRFARRLYQSPSGTLGSPWQDGEYLSADPRLGTLIKPLLGDTEVADRTKAILSMYQPWKLGIALPLLGLAGLVGACARRSLAPALVPGMLAISLVVLHLALNGPQTRYRYPVEPFVNVLALGALHMGVRQATKLVNFVKPLSAVRSARITSAGTEKKATA